MVTNRRTQDVRPIDGTVLALVPARSGSKAVKDKNIHPVAGHPLLGWSIAAARRSTLVDRVLLSTDSPAYAAVGEAYGAEVPFLRPEALAVDDAIDYGYVEHALDWLAERGEEPDLIVLLRPTSPLRQPEVIDEAVETFHAAEGATALRSLHEMSETAYKSFEITDGLLRPVGSPGGTVDDANAPRQHFPPTFEANGYADVLSTDFIRSTGLLYGDRVVPYMTDPVLEIDTRSDLEYLEYLVDRDPVLVEQLFS